MYGLLYGLLLSSPQELSHLVGCLLLHRGHEMAVNVQSAEITNDEVTVKYVDESGEQELIVDKLIVAVGRTPAIQNVLGQNSGVEIDDKGFIKVNSSCETSKVNIYAIGDTVYGPMLAHKATEEGMMVAENIAGESIEIDYERIHFGN